MSKRNTSLSVWPRITRVGPVYPTEDIDKMSLALGLKVGEVILDVGGGANPLPEAMLVVDYDLTSGHDRDGKRPVVDDRYICADIEALPLPDKSIDFVYCSHVLEHVRDPVKACSELMRVAKKGYIETPRKLAEMVAGYPSHRWLVDVQDGELTFERRWFIEHPLHNMMLAHVLNYDDAREQALVNFRNLTCVQFVWEDSFDIKVIETDGWEQLFDYDIPEHAGWSHFYFALNLLTNGAPAAHVRPHIGVALEKLPQEGVVYALDGVCRAILGDEDGAAKSFHTAQSLACSDISLEANLESLKSGPFCGGKRFHLPMGRGIAPVSSNA